jgi:hypothetical protein
MSVGADAPFPDALIWLSFVAAATWRIGLVTGVLVLRHRNPVVLSQAGRHPSTVSRGRIALGLGTGRLAEEFFGGGALHRPAPRPTTVLQKRNPRSNCRDWIRTSIESAQSLRSVELVTEDVTVSGHNRAEKLDDEIVLTVCNAMDLHNGGAAREL